MTAWRVSLCLVRKMIELVRIWNIARPCTQCSRQPKLAKYFHRPSISFVLIAPSGRSSGLNDISLQYILEELRSLELGLFFLAKEVDLELFLSQVGILLCINWFDCLHVQLIQLCYLFICKAFQKNRSRHIFSYRLSSVNSALAKLVCQLNCIFGPGLHESFNLGRFGLLVSAKLILYICIPP